jgi:hypothetical protein
MGNITALPPKASRRDFQKLLEAQGTAAIGILAEMVANQEWRAIQFVLQHVIPAMPEVEYVGLPAPKEDATLSELARSVWLRTINADITLQQGERLLKMLESMAHITEVSDVAEGLAQLRKLRNAK